MKALAVQPVAECRLLHWGSSTVADLARAGSSQLDQTWPGLEIMLNNNEQELRRDSRSGPCAQCKLSNQDVCWCGPSTYIKASEPKHVLSSQQAGRASVQSALPYGLRDLLMKVVAASTLSSQDADTLASVFEC